MGDGHEREDPPGFAPLAALRRHWWLVPGMSALCALALLAFGPDRSPRWTARVTLQLAQLCNVPDCVATAAPVLESAEQVSARLRAPAFLAGTRFRIAPSLKEPAQRDSLATAALATRIVRDPDRIELRAQARDAEVAAAVLADAVGQLRQDHAGLHETARMRIDRRVAALERQIATIEAALPPARSATTAPPRGDPVELVATIYRFELGRIVDQRNQYREMAERNAQWTTREMEPPTVAPQPAGGTASVLAAGAGIGALLGMFLAICLDAVRRERPAIR
jgi:hypothetical protein